MEYLSNPRIWLAAAVISFIIGSAWQLDGPSDIEVMQAVASNLQAVQSDKLVLP
jgi:hypothetical protein